MDDKFQDILDSLPEKPPRSRLEPYTELIGELRRRGRTYREIRHILAEKCATQVSVSTLHGFLRVQSRVKKKPAKRQPTALAKISRNAVTLETTGVNATKQAKPPIDEVQQRIVGLKLRSTPANAGPQQFQYDPNEPLRLPAKTRKVSSPENQGFSKMQLPCLQKATPAGQTRSPR
jgi:hypothetical protein